MNPYQSPPVELAVPSPANSSGMLNDKTHLWLMPAAAAITGIFLESDAQTMIASVATSLLLAMNWRMALCFAAGYLVAHLGTVLGFAWSISQ